MSEPASAVAVKKYRKVPSPLMAQMERALAARNQAVADPLLTTKECCALLRCSWSHLRQLIKSGVLPIWRPHPRAHIRLRQSAVLGYISGNFIVIGGKQ